MTAPTTGPAAAQPDGIPSRDALAVAHCEALVRQAWHEQAITSGIPAEVHRAIEAAEHRLRLAWQRRPRTVVYALGRVPILNRRGEPVVAQEELWFLDALLWDGMSGIERRQYQDPGR